MRKIEGHSNFFKTIDGAIVNMEKGLFEKIKKRKEKEKRMEVIEDRLNRIELLLERLVDGNK